MKKFISILTIMCLVFTLTLAATPTHVSANALVIPYAKNAGYGLTVQQIQIKDGFIIWMSLPKQKLASGKITKVTSSNKKVATQIKIRNASMFTFIAKKYGKTTFTITVKTGKKKTKNYKCNFTVSKYNCPVSSIKFGASGNLASKFKNIFVSHYERPAGIATAKVSIKPKSGWEITSITHSYYDKKSISKKIKNNSTIKYHDDNDTISINLKNKKSGVVQSLYISTAKISVRMGNL